MRSSDVTTIFDHLYWARDRILEASDRLGDAFPAVSGATVRDLRATLVHELDVEWSWRERLRGPDRTSFSPDDAELDAGDFPSVAAVRERWQADEAEMRAWLATLTDEALEGPCGAERSTSHPLWYHLQHLYTHGLQQLSDAAVLLTAAGRSPGELDFLAFVEARERAAG